jgi:hypothetical protein
MTLTNGDFPITAMSADSGTVTITGTKTGFSDVVKIFTVTKSKQGIQGLQGTAAKVVKLTASTQEIVLKPNGDIDGAQSVVFTTETQGTIGDTSFAFSPDVSANFTLETKTLAFADNATIAFPITVTFGDGTTQDTLTIIGVKPGADGAPGAPTVITVTSTTSLVIGTGSKIFTYSQVVNLGWTIGTRLRATNTSNISQWMEGVVTAVSSTSVTINVDLISSSGTIAT